MHKVPTQTYKAVTETNIQSPSRNIQSHQTYRIFTETNLQSPNKHTQSLQQQAYAITTETNKSCHYKNSHIKNIQSHCRNSHNKNIQSHCRNSHNKNIQSHCRNSHNKNIQSHCRNSHNKTYKVTVETVTTKTYKDTAETNTLSHTSLMCCLTQRYTAANQLSTNAPQILSLGFLQNKHLLQFETAADWKTRMSTLWHNLSWIVN